ncbi:MAG: site-specific integrase [Rhodospirillales bacterium]|nr:site-specific integrase [Rhodospirillales bacterium]
MATITQRAPGKFQCQVRRMGYRTQTKTFPTRTEAKTWCIRTEANLRADRSAALFSTLIERYRDTVTPTKKQAKQELCRIKWLLAHPIASVRLDKLSPHHITQYKDHRLEQMRSRGRDGSQATLHCLNLISAILTAAQKDWGIRVDNPVREIRKPRQGAGRTRRLSKEEHADLLTKSNGLLKDIIIVALETGMRRGEIHRIGKDDLRGGKLLCIPIAKNGHPRTIPLSSLAHEVICRRGSFHMTEPQFRHRWKTLLKLCGIEDFHFHDLRHEAVSRLFEKGLNVPEVALISGHRDYRMLQRYTHIRPELLGNRL